MLLQLGLPSFDTTSFSLCVSVFSLLCVFACVRFYCMDLRGLIEIKKRKKEKDMRQRLIDLWTGT